MYIRANPFIWGVTYAKGGASGGTGFFVHPNFVVTNFHVVEEWLLDDQKYNVNSIVVAKKKKDGTDGAIAIRVKKVIALSALYDLALLEMEVPIDSYLELEEETPLPDEPLFITGYPYLEPTHIIKKRPLVQFKYQYDFASNYSDIKGFSGSPVLNQEGKVVGVLKTTIFNMPQSIYPRVLRNFIDGHVGTRCNDYETAKSCIEQCLKNLESLAEHGNDEAQFELGFRLYRMNKSRTNKVTYRWMKKATENKLANAFAQYNLGVYYQQGIGVIRDRSRAADYFQKAAEKGVADAQYQLFLWYLYDEDRNLTEEEMSENDEKATYWLLKAAYRGHHLALEKWHKFLNNALTSEENQ